MIYINGRFLAQEITGVQRVAIEITKELDKIVLPGEVTVLAPPGVVNQISLSNIKIMTIGRKGNNFWTQITFPLYVITHGGVALTITGMCPILKPDYFVAHDVTFIRHPESFTKQFGLSYTADFKLTLKRCKRIFTVSLFSKEELIDIFNIDEGKIIVINNGVSDEFRMNKFEEPFNLSKWGLKAKEYYLCVGSQNLHKNQEYVYKCALRFRNAKFVIVGSDSIKTFQNSSLKETSNLIYTGYVTDNELLTLYAGAKGFIFPSLYEGFGLPPLEAITMGVEHVAVSDIEVMREIYPRGVYYFDPNDAEKFDFDKFSNTFVTEEDRDYYLNRYTFENAARTILDTIKKVKA